jgi:hypothetical protein
MASKGYIANNGAIMDIIKNNRLTEEAKKFITDNRVMAHKLVYLLDVCDSSFEENWYLDQEKFRSILSVLFTIPEKDIIIPDDGEDWDNLIDDFESCIDDCLEDVPILNWDDFSYAKYDKQRLIKSYIRYIVENDLLNLVPFLERNPKSFIDYVYEEMK